MKKSILLIFLTGITFCKLQGQTKLVLQPDSAVGKDVLLDSYAPNTNYCSFPELNAAAWTFNSIPILQRGLVAFDLSSIAKSSTINSAFLTLYFNPTSSNNTQHSQLSGSNEGLLQRVTDPWNEFTVTWNNQPKVTAQNQVEIPRDTNIHQNYIIDVTALVQDMVNNPSSSFGFMLKLKVESYYRILIFATSDHAKGSLHPKLEINYTNTASTELKAPNENNFLLYPNPAKDILTLKLNNPVYDSYTISIRDVLGHEIFHTVVQGDSDHSEFPINLKDIAANGMYVVQVSSSEETFTKRFMLDDY